jgi:hypothetical protein
MKFGVFVDSYYIKKWQYRAIKEIIDSTSFELGLVVLNKTKPKRNISFNNLFFYLYKYFLVRSKETQEVDIRLLSNTFTVKKFEVYKKGKFSEYFHKEDVDIIKSYDLDFTLRFGFGIIRGEILNAFKHGVWSFHHGDESKFRGGPYCFWEIYEDERENGSILQVLTNKLDGGIILKKGIFKTITHSYSKNIDQALKNSSNWPSLICKQIENNTFVKERLPSKTDAPIYLLPRNYQVLNFGIKIIKNIIRNFYYNYLTYDHWHVGLINKSIEEIIEIGIKPSDIKWLTNQSNNSFVADPFLFKFNNKVLLGLEYLSYNDFTGKIKVFFGKDFNSELPDFFDKVDYHLSYPNFFQFEKRFFCLPETFEANKLILFEKVDEVWKQFNLIDDVKPIDPDIIFHNGLYYLFNTFKGCNHETNLYVYFSENITKGWKEHPLNPVVSDVRSARGAGKIFSIKKELYRPGQNYSIHKEGSISISKIKKLTNLEYEEEIVKEILPIANSKFPDKIHTINSIGNTTVIDCCKIKSFILRPDILFYLFRSKLRK